jgi:hypothetical protein
MDPVMGFHPVDNLDGKQSTFADSVERKHTPA